MNENSGKWYKFVPNLITSLNLASGCISIVLALDGKIRAAVIFVLLAAIFDFFDGMAARLLKVSSAIGKELDSLADVVSFGVAPGIILFYFQRLLVLPNPASSLVAVHMSAIKWVLLLTPILIPIFSALRLAKFNIDERQTTSFIGMPTPANALFFSAIGWIMSRAEFSDRIVSFLPYIFALLSLLMSLILTSEIRMFGLKFKNLKWAENKTQFIFLFVSLILLGFMQVSGIPIIIILYILISISLHYKDRKSIIHLPFTQK